MAPLSCGVSSSLPLLTSVFGRELSIKSLSLSLVSQAPPLSRHVSPVQLFGKCIQASLLAPVDPPPTPPHQSYDIKSLAKEARNANMLTRENTMCTRRRGGDERWWFFILTQLYGSLTESWGIARQLNYLIYPNCCSVINFLYFLLKCVSKVCKHCAFRKIGLFFLCQHPPHPTPRSC